MLKYYVHEKNTFFFTWFVLLNKRFIYMYLSVFIEFSSRKIKYLIVKKWDRRFVGKNKTKLN